MSSVYHKILFCVYSVLYFFMNHFKPYSSNSSESALLKSIDLYKSTIELDQEVMTGFSIKGVRA